MWLAAWAPILRRYNEKVFLVKNKAEPPFKPRTWKGESRLALPELGGEIRFKRVRSRGNSISGIAPPG
jgi:hypothetical protein